MLRFLLTLVIFAFALTSSVSASNTAPSPIVRAVGNSKACLSSYPVRVAFTTAGLAAKGAAKGSVATNIQVLQLNIARSLIQNGNTVSCLYTSAHGDIPVLSYGFPCKNASAVGNNAYKCS